MLFRRVRSSTRRAAPGKYSGRWFVISSLGGRWPKKLRSFDGPALPLGDGYERACSSGAGCAGAVGVAAVAGCASVGEVGGSSSFSGSGTPRPLRMLIELARRMFIGGDEDDSAEEGASAPPSGLVGLA
jgi:hypothetical protein